MLGARSAGSWELSGSTLGPWSEVTGTTGRAAIEDWPAALNAAGLLRAGSSRCAGGEDRRFVHRTWPGLRHHDAANGHNCFRRAGFSCVGRGRYRSGCRRLCGRRSFLNELTRSCGNGGSFGRYGCRCNGYVYRGSFCVNDRGRNRDSWRVRFCRGRRCRRNFGLLCLRRSHGWLDDHRYGRNHAHCRARGGYDRRRLGYHGARGRLACDGAYGRRRCNDRGRLTDSGNDLARFGLGGRGGHRGGYDGRGRFGRWLGSCNRGRGSRWNPARLRLVFLFFGEDRLEHVARFGDVGEIDFGGYGLRTTRGRRVTRCAGAIVELPPYLFSLVLFERAGVGLACADAELCQYLKNLAALDFQLSREIVDSNLTHPPLFKKSCPKPLVAHSYLMAMACC